MGFFSGKKKAEAAGVQRKASEGDAPMTPDQLEKLYPDCIAQMKEKWKAENPPAPAPDPEDGNGDGEPVDPPPSTEPEAKAVPGSESRGTQDNNNNDESAEAGTGASVAADGASARFVSKEVGTMANESNKAGAEKPGDVKATVAELRAKWPGDANSAFVVDCLEKGLTMPQAIEARLNMVEGRNQQIEKDTANLNGGVLAAIGGGVVRAASQPVEAPGGAKPKGTAVAAYYAKVDALVAGGMARYKAINQVNTEHPDLQEAAVAEACPDPRRPART